MNASEEQEDKNLLLLNSSAYYEHGLNNLLFTQFHTLIQPIMNLSQLYKERK